MARTNKEETSTTSSTPARRRFSVSTANIPDAAPTIVDGIYQGNIKNIKADAEDKQFANWQEVEGLQLFDVIEVITGKKGERVHTGEYTVVGALTYGVELPNIPGEQDLPMDIMSIYGGRLVIKFAKDEDGQWGIDPRVDNFGVVNRVWKTFCKVFDLDDEKLDSILEATPFDEDAEIAIPERLQDVPDVMDMLQAVAFYKSFFSLVAEEVNGRSVKVSIARRSLPDDTMRNEINCGNFNSSCGLLPA